MSILTEEWLTKAKAFVRLRPLVTASNDPKLAAFSKALGLAHSESDFKVLAFWATGLKKVVRHKDIM